MDGNPLTCRELVELVTDYLEDKLPAADRARFEAHLAGCSGCRRHLAQMNATIRIMGALTEENIPARGRDELLEAFRNWKRG
jgi:anti-sigma factor RsiW